MTERSDADAPLYPALYVETSVLSYLVSDPSNDRVIRDRQRSTHDWWVRRGRWELLTSTAVVAELARGDHRTALKRLELLGDLALLPVSQEARVLAAALLSPGPLPPKARVDAEHIAVAAVMGIGSLVTWNLKHIANPAMRRRVEEVCRAAGYEPPITCTPAELLARREDAR